VLVPSAGSAAVKGHRSRHWETVMEWSIILALTVGLVLFLFQNHPISFLLTIFIFPYLVLQGVCSSPSFKT
jgi:hypothetical protein